MGRRKSLDIAFYKITREDALREQHFQCEYCLDTLTYKEATADHVKARKNGGTDEKENIVACCSRCNRLKDRMSVGSFKKKIKHPNYRDDIEFHLAWSRRRINLALGRYKKTVLTYVGIA